MKEWKREEWYNSAEFKKLRLFGNVASEVHHKCQYLYDILEIILADKPDLNLMVFDRFNVVGRQLRVLQLEAKRLVTEANSLTQMLEPHKFVDWNEYGPIPPEQQVKTDEPKETPV